MPDINIIDLAVYGIIGLSLAWGVFRGLFASVLGIAALILAIVVAYNGIAYVNTTMRSALGNSPLVSPLSALIIFFAAFFVFGMIGRLINKGIKKIDVGGLNMIGGGVFGIARGALLSLLFVLLISALAVPNTNAWRESHTVIVLGKVLQPMAATLTSPYRDWLKFDAKGRPLLVDGRKDEKSSPVRLGKSGGNEDVQQQEEESLKGKIQEIQQKAKEKEKVLTDVVEELQNYENIRSAHGSTRQDIKQEDYKNKIEMQAALKKYVACELEGRDDCTLKVEAVREEAQEEDDENEVEMQQRIQDYIACQFEGKDDCEL